jgi:hypothetical protein
MSLFMICSSSYILHGIKKMIHTHIYEHPYYIIMRKDRLIMGYFDNLDNEFLNKYNKILKIKKSL